MLYNIIFSMLYFHVGDAPLMSLESSRILLAIAILYHATSLIRDPFKCISLKLVFVVGIPNLKG